MFRKFNIKKLVLLLSFVLISTAAVGATLGYLMVKVPSLTNIFQPALEPYGDLLIRKTVEHPFEEPYTIPEDLSFTFEVHLGLEYADQEIRLSSGESRQADANGVVEVSVKPGTSMEIEHIKTDTEVTVIEKEKPGFSEKEGKTEQTITIRSEEDQELSFTNKYTPDPVPMPANITVSGSKTLEGRNLIAGDTFTFILEEKQNDTWKTVAEETVVYEEGDTNHKVFDFNDTIQGYMFDTAKTYTFRVSEKQENITGILYDNTVKEFDVVVGDADMDGYLEIQSVIGASGAESAGMYHVSADFVNKYSASGTASTTLYINKKFVDHKEKELSPSGFVFELKTADGTLVKTTEPTLESGEARIILDYTTDDIGTHQYVLTEKYAGETVNGVTYDDASYEITVSVQDNYNGTLSASAAEGSTEFLFTNKYDPEDAKVNIGGTKTLEGRRTPIGAEEFAFELYQTSADFELAEGAVPVETVGNTADRTFTFTELTFDEKGTYYYVVKEKDSEEPNGIQYDETKYHITITVDDKDKNGVLEAQTTYVKNSEKVDALVFTNTYSPIKYAVFEISGAKILDGKELTAGMFQFILYETDENYEKKDGCVPMMAENAADGTFSFGYLSIDKEGTYYYFIEEDTSDKLDGIEYDDMVYHVKVTVTDDQKGVLEAKVEYLSSDNLPVESVEFNNKYVEATQTPTPNPGEGTPTPTLTPGEETPTPTPSPGEETPSPDGEDTAISGDGSTNTGDNSNIIMYIVLSFVSIGILAILVVRKRLCCK